MGEISTILHVLLHVLLHGKRKCQVDIKNTLIWYNNLSNMILNQVCVSLIVLFCEGLQQQLHISTDQ